MATNPPPNFCPYKGLQPYTEADRAYFFGRERDQEIIASNLYAAPLTILYGASGVGKTSVLLAGVVPQLRQTPRLAVVVFRAWQDGNFLAALKTQTLDATQKSLGKSFALDPSLPFDDFVETCASALRGNLFFILDQFEEYFLYHPPSDTGFDADLARTINRREVAANFLLALREDGLSRLDRFKGRIPNLLSNMLRLEHLDHAAALSAIRNPLTEYNRQVAPPTPVRIEDDLTQAVIEQVRTGSVTLGAGGIGQLVDPTATRIETPYLQLVMTRLWNEERGVHSDVLRQATFDRLGGAQQIVRTHLDTTMQRLPNADREIAARAFRYLVTPSQTKIAYTASDLADFAAVPQTKLEPVLRKLAEPDVRVLRSVAPAVGEKKETRYEIFHDVLAPAVLDWRERYQEQTRNTRVRYLVAIVVPVIFLALALSVFQSYQTQLAQVQAQVAQATVQIAQAQVTAAQAQATVVQAQVDATIVRVEATQVAQNQAQFAQTQVRATQTQEKAQVATQAAVVVDNFARQAAEATRTEAAKVVATSQVAARTPSPTPPDGTPAPGAVVAQAATAAAATSAAQVLNFRVTSARAEIAPDVIATCPITLNLQASIAVNQPGTVTYRWERSDGALLALNGLDFKTAGTRIVTDTWKIDHLVSGWVRLRIASPDSMQSNQASFSFRSTVPSSLQSVLQRNSKVSSNLGCPEGAPGKTMDGSLQVFQNGLMLSSEDKRVFVLLTDGAWSEFRDTWERPQPEGGLFKPPPKLFEPQRGFGKIWRELGGEDAKIGWATTSKESAIKIQIQRFDRGFAIIIDNGKDFKILFTDKKWTDL
ncbi:MAG: ATP-binding protein [Chloroflexi bacterium]|nr:ATP-binding protein [Chloroflexota bacterium]